MIQLNVYEYLNVSFILGRCKFADEFYLNNFLKRIRIFMIVFIVIYLILCMFMFYRVLKKSHWTCWKSIPFMKFSSM